MGFLKRLRDWDATYDDAGLPSASAGRTGSAGAANEAQVVAAILKVVALVEAVLGVISGIGLSRATEGSTRTLGLAPGAWVVILGALVSALILYALAAGLSCLDDIRRNTGRPATR
jgi:hypothetical protein